MTPAQCAVFIEERKWEFRGAHSYTITSSIKTFKPFHIAFGFAAALLEGLPFIGLFFRLTNRIGAAMWAYGQSL